MESSHQSRRKERLREVMPWSYPVVGFASVAILLVAYLCQFAQIVHAEYTLVELREQRKVLEREQSEFELAIQELTSLERVEQVATGKLGMVTPEDREVLEIPTQVQAAGAERHLAASRLPERQ